MERVVRKSYEREREQIGGWSESVTDQANAQETEVAEIVKRFTRTGQGIPLGEGAVYADVSGLNDDLTILKNKLAAVEQQIKEAEKRKQDEMDEAGTQSEQTGNETSQGNGGTEGTPGETQNGEESSAT